MGGHLARLRAYWRSVRRPSQLDADMESEMRFHIDMEAQRLMRRHGLDAQEARRQALIAFGGIDKYREAGRDALRLTVTRGLSVDVKLAVREQELRATLRVTSWLRGAEAHSHTRDDMMRRQRCACGALRHRYVLHATSQLVLAHQ